MRYRDSPICFLEIGFIGATAIIACPANPKVAITGNGRNISFADFPESLHWARYYSLPQVPQAILNWSVFPESTSEKKLQCGKVCVYPTGHASSHYFTFVTLKKFSMMTPYLVLQMQRDQ